MDPIFQLFVDVFQVFSDCCSLRCQRVWWYRVLEWPRLLWLYLCNVWFPFLVLWLCRCCVQCMYIRCICSVCFLCMFVGDVWDACHDIYMDFVVRTAWRRDARYGSTSQFSKCSTWGYILNDIVASYHGSEAPASICCNEDIHGLKIKKVQNVKCQYLLVALLETCYRRSGRGRDMSLEVKFGRIIFPCLI